MSDIPKPDYEFWARMPGWRMREAAALLLDLDPEVARSRLGGSEELSNEIARYTQLRRQLERARVMGLVESPCRPKAFLDWAKSNRFDIPVQLQERVKQTSRIINWRRRYQKLKQEYDEFSRPTLDDPNFEVTEPPFLKMRSIFIVIAAMAFEGYKHKDPNSAVSDIRNDADLLGLKIDHGSILEVLRDTESYLPGGENGPDKPPKSVRGSPKSA